MQRITLCILFLKEIWKKIIRLIKNELLSNGIAESVTKTSAPVTEGWSNSWGIEWREKTRTIKQSSTVFAADDNICKTVGLQVVQGRDIDLDTYSTDSTAIIINESAVRLMNFKNPIGEIIKDNGIEWHVVGVVKDFILKSPYQLVEPMVIEGAKGWFNVVHIRFNSIKTTVQSLAEAEKIFLKNTIPIILLNIRLLMKLIAASLKMKNVPVNSQAYLHS